MAEIRFYGPWRRLRSDAGVHILRYRRGQLVASGRGLVFWFLRDGASIAELPADDRDLPFLFNSRSKDFQEITVQGTIIWRVTAPERLGERIDFSIDLATGRHLGQPVDQIANLLTGVSQQFAAQYLTERAVSAILEGGVAPLQAAIEGGLSKDERILAMGLEVVGVRVADISPTADLKRALQTPTFERLQQQADQATFERRALAVEKERAIAENELANKIELARREKDLISTDDENARAKAQGQAAAMKIDADAEGERIRIIQQASADMERARIDIYRDMPPAVILGLAAQGFAEKLKGIEHLNVTPDLVAALGGFLGRAQAGPAAKA